MSMLHKLVKCAWHRPRASKDNATAAQQILGIKRTIHKDEDIHLLYRSEMLVVHSSRMDIVTLMGWTLVSFDMKNLNEVLKLGTQTSYKSSEHPKCDTEN